MSVHRRAAKRDTNEGVIVKSLRAAGATVWQVSGKGLPDLLVGYHGETLLLEVKMPGKGLTPDQETAHGKWDGSPIYVVESPEQALHIIGASDARERCPWTDEERAEFLPAPRKP
jgi:hypothetical protein